MLTVAATGLLFALYVLSVRKYRHVLKKKHIQLAQNATRDGKDQLMDIQTAFEIHSNVTYKEFPFLTNKSLEFALFKTYGIPSISKLLAATKEFETNSLKRYDDTNILLCEMNENFLYSERGALAMARMNKIHSNFKIKNDDYLYTLSLFILEPIEWVNKFGYRKMEPCEQEATFVYWREIGKNMKIDNIPSTLQEMKRWSEEYEKKHMVFAHSNVVIAEKTMDLFVSIAPSVLHNLVKKLAMCFMNDRLCKSFGFSPSSSIYHYITNGTMTSMSFFIKYLCFPRQQAYRRTPAEYLGRGQRLIPCYYPFPDKGLYEKGYNIEELGPNHIKGINETDFTTMCPLSAKKQ